MKKFNTLLATIALALPIAVTPLAPAATLIANASTKATKSTTYDLTKATTLKKVAYHATKPGALYKINFAADRSVAFVSPVKAKLATKTTYCAVKAIVLTSGKKNAEKTTYCLLENTKGQKVGWIKATEVTKGAYVAAKATTTKKTIKKAERKAAKQMPKRVVTKETTKKAATKKVTSIKPAKKATPKKAMKKTPKATTILVSKKAKAIKAEYTAKKAAPTCKITFSTKKGTARITPRGTLKAGKRYTATKAFYGKTSKKAMASEFVYLNGTGWAARTSLKAAK